MKSFFNDEHGEQYRKKKPCIVQHSDEKKFILCFDYIEQLVKESEEECNEFKNFIVELLEDCENLSIVITSLVSLHNLPKNYQPEVQIVGPLKANYAASMFHEQC